MSKSVLLLAVSLSILAAAPRAQATPLDKLFGGQRIVVGNLVFGDFSAPSFSGAGPSNIDVQGVLVIDPATGQQQAGLRFTVIPAPFVLSPSGGPHEVGFWIDYSVTDSTGQLATLAQSVDGSVSGQAGALYWTTASPSQAVADGSLADPTLTIVQICNWFGSVCAQTTDIPSAGTYRTSSGPQSAVAALAPGATLYVQHEVDLQISNRKGIPGGTITLQDFQILFAE
jgi:hypothetical protein